jgi:hypothetical protein
VENLWYENCSVFEDHTICTCLSAALQTQVPSVSNVLHCRQHDILPQLAAGLQLLW